MPIRVRFAGCNDECVLPVHRGEEERFETDLRTYLEGLDADEDEQLAPAFNWYTAEGSRADGPPSYVYIRFEDILFASISRGDD